MQPKPYETAPTLEELLQKYMTAAETAERSAEEAADQLSRIFPLLETYIKTWREQSKLANTYWLISRHLNNKIVEQMIDKM